MKNLEDEYKRSQQEPVPQLWDRIEKNLPEKKKKGKLIYITRIFGVCAAAVVLMLLIPNILNLRMDRSESASPSAPKTDQYSAQNECQDAQLTAEEAPENVIVTDTKEQTDSDGIAEKEEADQESSGSNQSMQESDVHGISEIMKVIKCSETENILIYTLQRKDGSTLSASLSEDIETVLELERDYLFTLIKEDESSEIYTVCKIENIQD